MSADSPLAWVAIDFLCCLLLVVYTMIAPPPKPASIDTLGQYAVEVTWPAGRNDDMDTYVEDPAGNIVSFSDHDVGLMHLEHDDLGKSSDRVQYAGTAAVVNDNRERVVLRGVIPGEVTVNVHAYRMTGPGACPVMVKLYRLRGDDRTLLERRLTLERRGEEVTAFRFALDRRGKLVSHNELSKKLLGTVGGTFG